MPPHAQNSCHAKSAERFEYDFVSRSLTVRLRLEINKLVGKGTDT